jgi:putative ABC transport system permease protein
VCQLFGIDDATLIGAPTQMVDGSVRDLRREGAVIVDIYSAAETLAAKGPDGKKIPLKVGDHLEINSKRAVVVGLCKVTRGFYPQPIIFTTETQFDYFNPAMLDRIGFILAKSRVGAKVEHVCAEIDMNPGMNALTRDQFKDRIIEFFLKTGILINFGLSVALGVIIGFSIAGQIFYIMTLENIMYYALIKAVGGSQMGILKMIVVQAAVVGVIGFSLGIGATVLWGHAIEGTTLAFLFPWQLLLFTGFIVFLICVFTAALSIQKVFRVDPKALMGN